MPTFFTVICTLCIFFYRRIRIISGIALYSIPWRNDGIPIGNWAPYTYKGSYLFDIVHINLANMETCI